MADYSRLLLEGLRRGYEVEAYTDAEDGNRRTSPVPCYHWREFPQSESGRPPAMPLYQMGNSLHHRFIYPFVFRHPGVLVLHDLALHHSRLAMYLENPEVAEYREDLGDAGKRARALAKLQEYAAEVEAAYPGEGQAVAEIALRMGGGRLLYEFPLHELLVRASKMTVVHSPAARQEVLRGSPESVVRAVRMGIELPRPVPRNEARQRLGLPAGLVMASFGLVTPEKRISAVLRCLKRLVDAGVEVGYVLVGGSVPHFDPLEEARQLGIADRVRLTGRVSESDFWLYAFAADVCLNLRYPSAGETSSALLRLLAAGRAVMVTDDVFHLDLPPDVVARSSLQGGEDGMFCDVLDLLRRPERRKRLEQRSRQYVQAEHSPEAMLADYARCLDEAESLAVPASVFPRHLV